jgi:UPF0755 protein
MMKKAFFFLFVAAPILAGFLISITIYGVMNLPYEGKDIYFKVENGAGFGKINHQLAKSGLIPSASFFYYYARYSNQMNKFKSGTFLIKSGMNSFQIFDELVYGKPVLMPMIVTEGKNIFDIIQVISSQFNHSQEEIRQMIKYPNQNAKISEFLQNEFFNQFKNDRELGLNQLSLEGFLFPDTYLFDPQSSSETIILAMLKNFQQKTKDIKWQNHPFLSPYQILTLASIVEKETGAAIERPVIAGVFLNRLNKKMRLQSDPTTIYGLGETYQGNLKKEHLLQETAYNTYKIPALPVGPICNPSISAIQAILEPDQHDYLYFVSKNDGTHEFTRNYEDHLNAVKNFQLNKANRENKSWRDLKQ